MSDDKPPTPPQPDRPQVDKVFTRLTESKNPPKDE